MVIHITLFTSIAIRSRVTKSIALLMLALVSLLNLQSVWAEPRYYDIEVIIFDDADEKYLRSEYWPQKPESEAAPLPANEITYPIIASLAKSEISPENGNGTAADDATIFQNIEPSILSNKAKRISASRHYHMLFYGAWTQEGLDSKHAISIDLKQLTNHGNVKTKNTITGELKIVLARYLHFYSELEYNREHKVRSIENAVVNNAADDKQYDHDGTIKENNNNAPNSSLTEKEVMVDYYPIKSHRRMRSKVLHYIDHPLVGILVQINPVKKAGVSH